MEDGTPLAPPTSDATATAPPPKPTSRHRLPWAQLLRRVLHIDALACFDVIYQRARRQVEAPGGADSPPLPYRMDPHPGLTYLLEKLDAEAAAGAGETSRE